MTTEELEKALAEAKAKEAAKSSTSQTVKVGERRINATWSSNLKNCLEGDFTVLKQHTKGVQVWLTIGLADGQRLLIASGDLLDRHLTGTKIFDGEPVEGQECPLREGLKIGIRDGNVTFA